MREVLAGHFGPVPLEDLVVTRGDFPHWMRPDLQRSIEKLVAGLAKHRFAGLHPREREQELRFADLAEAGSKSVAIGPAVYQAIDIGEAEAVRCVTRGLWLAEREGVPFALLVDVEDGYRHVRVRVEIAARADAQSRHVTARIIAELRAGAAAAQCWRGKVLVLDPAQEDFEISAAGLRVERAAPVRREDIVMAQRTFSLIERNTIGFVSKAERLLQLGLSQKKGVLLYGPPGTGKTLVVRWLVGALEGYTKLIVSAGHYGLLAESLEMARALQPALVVLEDIDLVGAHRDGPWAAAGGALNLLLNEMDGLSPEARVLFVLTTNRPEVLEPALAARPGRVDQAIEIALPGAAERLLLVKRYAGSLGVEEELAARIAKQTGRASPAFIKELMRRAAQAMLERGGGSVLQWRDVEGALADMLGAGGKLGAAMLGADHRVGFAAAMSS
ncbi:MAG: ATP-binding protein [Betaproteobacteria bacterium]|nr:ATP-binding protein [Betaproteobacteria bacterium]